MLEAQTEIVKSTFIIIGSPNSGKTTLYNWLTNSKFKTVNYPGSTVEYSSGFLAKSLRTPSREVLILDTPGTYSLEPKGPDEKIAISALKKSIQEEEFAGILLVMDGTQVFKNLGLLLQIQMLKLPTLVVVTMDDLLKKEKVQIDLQLLRSQYGFSFLTFNGVTGDGLKEVSEALNKKSPLGHSLRQPWPILSELEMLESVRAHKKILADTIYRHTDGSPKEGQLALQKIRNVTEKIDALLMNPYLGIFFFIGVMALFFGSIFWLAAPAMDLIDEGFGFAIDWFLTHQYLGEFWTDFFANGILSSFAAVLVFVPQIFILFLGIGVLEGTGYLARAAAVIDRPLSLVGLSGRSFVPLLSGFACSVPAMMATRNIESARERMIANFIIPLMTCSARLPVYALLVGFLMRDRSPWMAGAVFALLYVGAMFMGALIAALINTFWTKKERSRFVMELPLYRIPKPKIVFLQSLLKTKSYVFRAGPIIFVLATMIWFGTNFPKGPAGEPVKLESSYLGKTGKVLNPVFEPMGVDWRVGVGLVSAFAAREVFVSSLALVMNIESDNDEAQQSKLMEIFATAKKSDGTKLFTFGSVVGLLLFFMISLQCVSTIGVSIKETGSWKFGLTQVVVLNVLGYLAAVLAYNILG